MGHQPGPGAGAIAVAEDNVGAGVAAATNDRRRRHRMAIDQHGDAEAGAGLGDQGGEGVVIGGVALGQAGGALGPGQRPTADGLAVGDDFGDHPEAGADPGAGDVRRRRHRVQEHRRVDLARVAVGVDPDPWEMGQEQGRAEARHPIEQLIDKSVFRRAQGRQVQTAGRQQGVGIAPPAMRRGEDQRHALRGRPANLEGRIVGVKDDMRRLAAGWLRVGVEHRPGLAENGAQVTVAGGPPRAGHQEACQTTKDRYNHGSVQALPDARAGPPDRPRGRVAQRESTTLTS